MDVFSVRLGMGGDRKSRERVSIRRGLRRGGGDFAGTGMLILAILYVISEFRSQ